MGIIPIRRDNKRPGRGDGPRIISGVQHLRINLIPVNVELDCRHNRGRGTAETEQGGQEGEGEGAGKAPAMYDDPAGRPPAVTMRAIMRSTPPPTWAAAEPKPGCRPEIYENIGWYFIRFTLKKVYINLKMIIE